jgi:hypothetical protein
MEANTYITHNRTACMSDEMANMKCLLVHLFLCLRYCEGHGRVTGGTAVMVSSLCSMLAKSANLKCHDPQEASATTAVHRVRSLIYIIG